MRPESDHHPRQLEIEVVREPKSYNLWLKNRMINLTQRELDTLYLALQVNVSQDLLLD